MSENTQALRSINLIEQERLRQISQEGYSFEHDDHHDDGSLTAAAHCYLQVANAQIRGWTPPSAPPSDWPWAPEDWKPANEPMRNMVKAGALIAAEMDRLRRQEEAA